MYSTIDISFAAYLYTQGIYWAEMRVNHKGKVDIFYDLSSGEAAKLKLQFLHSGTQQYAAALDQVKLEIQDTKRNSHGKEKEGPQASQWLQMQIVLSLCVITRLLL